MRGKFHDLRYDIFVNPTFKEMGDANDFGVRFIADNKTKKLYVWGAANCIHKDAWKEISGKDDEIKLSQKGIVFEGVAIKKGGKYVMVNSDQMSAYFDMDYNALDEFREKFKWVNKYIEIDTPLKQWRE